MTHDRDEANIEHEVSLCNWFALHQNLINVCALMSRSDDYALK